jgi:hypothetical protein
VPTGQNEAQVESQGTTTNQQNIEMNELTMKENNTISQNSEKLIYHKSSVDTKLVNHEVEQQKYHLVEEDHERKSENEFVFSENVNIDTLSYNEPIVESLKKKIQESNQNVGASNATTNNINSELNEK